MTAPSCTAARQALEARQLAGWTGLPAGCTPDALFGTPLDDTWGERKLGEDFVKVRSRLLELSRYYRPMASVVKDTVVMFDAMNPTLEGGWAPLEADLGKAEATYDWIYGTVSMAGGERVYARRGITVFTNRDGDDVLHVAVYAPTSVEAYVRTLRPATSKVSRPKH